jgi:transposase InsO family protein
VIDRSFPTLEIAQAELDAWVTDYNTNRPHKRSPWSVPAESHPASWALPIGKE